MEIFFIEGLNCYTSCVISIAKHLGLPYEVSFYNLWSETSFIYDERFNLYYTKRMLENLETLGLKLDKVFCDTPEQVEKTLDSVKNLAFLIIGMDAYYLPWSPIYQLSHDKHYFILQKNNTDSFFCFDPSYGESNIQLPRREILLHAFEINIAEQVPDMSPHMAVKAEAQAIMHMHPNIQEKIFKEIESEKDLALVGRYIGAFIDNRCLYRYYLNKTISNKYARLFHDNYLMEWKAVKNGIFKASLLQKNAKIIGEVKSRFSRLIEKEIEMAEQMAETSPLC